MPKCSHCGADTELFVSSAPVCLSCDLEPKRGLILKTLEEDVKRGKIIAAAASRQFDHIVNRPSGSEAMDGKQQIYNVSKAMSLAHENLMEALKRLNNFVIHGTIPGDLKVQVGPGSETTPGKVAAAS